MAQDMSGQMVLAESSDGCFSICMDDGPYPGTDPLFKIRRVERIQPLGLRADDPMILEVLGRKEHLRYANGYDFGELLLIPKAQAEGLLSRVGTQPRKL